MKCIHKKYINILHKYLPTKKMIGPYCHYSIQQQKNSHSHQTFQWETLIVFLIKFLLHIFGGFGNVRVMNPAIQTLFIHLKNR